MPAAVPVREGQGRAPAPAPQHTPQATAAGGSEAWHQGKRTLLIYWHPFALSKSKALSMVQDRALWTLYVVWVFKGLRGKTIMLIIVGDATIAYMCPMYVVSRAFHFQQICPASLCNRWQSAHMLLCHQCPNSCPSAVLVVCLEWSMFHLCPINQSRSPPGCLRRPAPSPPTPAPSPNHLPLHVHIPQLRCLPRRPLLVTPPRLPVCLLSPLPCLCLPERSPVWVWWSWWPSLRKRGACISEFVWRRFLFDPKGRALRLALFNLHQSRNLVWINQ